MSGSRMNVMVPDKDDTLNNWIEEVNMEGPDISLEKLEELINKAPETAKKTSDYYYMLGWLDMKYLYENNI